MSALSLRHLERLDAAWAERGAALRRSRQPGLSEAELRAKAAARFPSLHLPDELVLWWGWHNGSATERLSSVRFYIPFEEALDDYALRREWDEPCPHLFPIVDQSPAIMVECGTEPTTTGRVFLYFPDTAPRLKFETVGDLVEVWIGFLESGAWAFDSAGQPVTNGDLVPDQYGGLI